MPDVILDPRLSERLKETYNLQRTPTTVADFVELGRTMIKATPELRQFLMSVRAGKAVVGQTEADRGQSFITPEGREARVMCGYDSLSTALLRGEGIVRASCFHCKEKMEIEIKGGKIASASSPSIVFWFGDGPKGIPVCDHLNLFPDRDHLAAWLRMNPEELGVAFTLDEAVEFIGGYLEGL